LSKTLKRRKDKKKRKYSMKKGKQIRWWQGEGDEGRMIKKGKTVWGEKIARFGFMLLVIVSLV